MLGVEGEWCVDGRGVEVLGLGGRGRVGCRRAGVGVEVGRFHQNFKILPALICIAYLKEHAERRI